MQNLELACAQHAQKLAAKLSDEKPLRDALAVLEEQGVYAFFLFCHNESEELSDRAKDFLASTPQGASLLRTEGQDTFPALRQLAEDLDRLLLARELLRQMLVYARYHLKAKGASRQES